jgi:hypothetical protein
MDRRLAPDFRRFDFCLDAFYSPTRPFGSREPESASLENALSRGGDHLLSASRQASMRR